MESRLHWVGQLKRPQGKRPPDGRNFDDSYKIANQSLEVLRPLGWLDDNVVNTFIRSLCVARPGKYVAFDSTALEALSLQLKDAQSLSQAEIDKIYYPHRTLAATVSGNRGLVFMPFCIREHWILVVADLKSRVVRVYDSMVSVDGRGTVVRSARVEAILPYVWGILRFCIDEDECTIDPMSVPFFSC